MQLYKSVLAALAIGSVAVGGCGTESTKDNGKIGASNHEVGELGMALTLPDDSEVTSVNYSITGPGGFIRNGVVPVGNSSKLAFRVGNLPIQNGYTIALGATTSFNQPCQGSQMFNIINNQTTSVTVVLTCQATDDKADLIVDGQFKSCPLVTTLQAIPAEAFTGATMAFTAGISHGDSDVKWTATDGTFTVGTGYDTVYTCATPGIKTITATIANLGDCHDALTMTVECTQSIACGDGAVSGVEECDTPNTPNDACTDNCKNNVCGDGVVFTGVEECDDGNGSNADTCATTCKTIACGNARVDPGEDCDDGNQVNTDACPNSCRNPGCGDGIVQASLNEQCDDGNLINTDTCTYDATTPKCQNAKCGDAVVQAGVEACDDGNLVNGDGCETNCKLSPVTDKAQKIAACATCRQANCRDFDSYDAVGHCFEDADSAKVQLCVDLRNCMYDHKSGYDPTNGAIESFCGTADPSTTCQNAGGANGPCRVEWALATSVCTSAAACNQAAIDGGLATILGRASSPSRPSGAAYSLTNCDSANCAVCKPQ
ncbi:MAG: DUF4215 domain-containing protein [Myxococcales bacterium]